MKRMHPMQRDGVGASTVFLPRTAEGTHRTLLDFFVRRFSRIPAQVWQSRFDQGLIHDAQGHALAAEAAYLAGQHLHYFREVHAEPRIPFEAQVLYRDAHLVVADKPHFLPVTPSGRYVQETLLVRLKNSLSLPELSPLHRLDRDTAGLVLFAVQAKERGAYQQLFATRQMEKTYEAVAPFNPHIQHDWALPLVRMSRLQDSPHHMQVQEASAGHDAGVGVGARAGDEAVSVVDAPNSKTQIQLIQRLEQGLALWRLQPHTGRRHQLRVHMAALGMPILHDGIYPVLTPEQSHMTEEDYAKPLQLLAKHLAFDDPITGERRVFQSLRTLQAAA